jgi:predicted  nucleic acid-binding Zn-ribbon protein
MEDNQDYQKRFQSQLAEISKRLDELKETARTTTDTVSIKLEGVIDELKKKQKEVEDKMPEIRSATLKTWEDVKVGADRALDELKKAFDDAGSHFR